MERAAKRERKGGRSGEGRRGLACHPKLASERRDSPLRARRRYGGATLRVSHERRVVGMAGFEPTTP